MKETFAEYAYKHAQAPMSQDQLLRRRYEQGQVDLLHRRRRAHALRVIAVGCVVIILLIRIIGPDFILAGTSIWVCIPSEI